MSRAAIFLTLLLSTAGAHAAPVDLLKIGREEFDEGEREFNLGHYDRSLDHFETAYRLTARAPLLYNVAVVLRRLWEQTRRIELLEQAVDRLRAFLSATRKGDPTADAQRQRVERELTSADEELQRERAARAQGEAALTLGEELLQRGKLAEARAQLERYEHAGPHERPGLAHAFLLRGGVAVATGELRAATSAYLSALSLDRALTLDPAAPEAARHAFADAEERLGAAPPCGVAHGAPGSLRIGAPVELTFSSLSDPAHLVTALVVHYRAGGGAFSTLPRQPVGKVPLPGGFAGVLTPGTRVEYYAEALTDGGDVLQHLGTAALPYAVTVAVPPPRSIAKRAWFWGVMGGAAAVVATGIGLAVHFTQPPPPIPVPVTLGAGAP